MGVALLLRLNKPLTLAATFINNPLMLTPIVVCSIELGGLLRHGSLQPWHQLISLSTVQLKEQLVSWVLGSLVLGVLAGGVAAMMAAAAVCWMRPSRRNLS